MAPQSSSESPRKVQGTVRYYLWMVVSAYLIEFSVKFSGSSLLQVCVKGWGQALMLVHTVSPLRKVFSPDINMCPGWSDHKRTSMHSRLIEGAQRYECSNPTQRGLAHSVNLNVTWDTLKDSLPNWWPPLDQKCLLIYPPPVFLQHKTETSCVIWFVWDTSKNTPGLSC